MGARAAVDVGSNSVRLLVADASGRRLAREMAVTALATGVDRTGRLDDAALELTIATIAGFRDIWRSHGVTDRVRIAATSAVRDAEDRDRFFTAVTETTGIRAEVLSGAEEAGLAFAGAASAVETPPGAIAVVDIGGGSTELIVGSADGTVRGSVSLQLGCVRLTERDLHTDPPTPAQIACARETIAGQLALADGALASQGVAVRDAAALVAVAGTATTLAALHLGLEEYLEERIHGSRLPASALEQLAEDLNRVPAAERATLGPMQPGRELVIHGGALILSAILEHYGLVETIISESDSLDGLVATLA